MTDDELIERMAEAIHMSMLGRPAPYSTRQAIPYARAALAVARPAIRNEVLDEVASRIDGMAQGLTDGNLREAIGAGFAADLVRSLRLGADESAPVGVKREHSPLADSKGDSGED